MKRDYNKAIEMTALYEVSKLLGASLNMKQNVGTVMRVLAEYLDMKRGTVALLHEDEVSILAAYGMTKDEIRRGRYRLGEGIIGRVAKLGVPIVISNISDEPLFLNKTGSRKMITKESIAFLCVPIKFKSEVLGVLSVDRLFGAKEISFEEDLRLLKIIASLIGQAIRLHKELEKERQYLLEEQENLKQQLKGRYSVENIIGQSDIMQEVFAAIHRVAPSRATVLVRGESGTGKELVAKAIHYMSPRSKRPFIKYNCAAVPEGLLESELFGHERGAFTGAAGTRKGRFELADGGTLFLDEIGDLPIALQPKILRVLQEREFERVGGEKTLKVDVRLVSATSRNLEDYVREGKFRGDLYYRLNVVPIYLPALRERKEDVLPLTEFFLERFNRENGKSVDLATEVLKAFMEYEWPGNVRELENTVERLVVMATAKTVTRKDLPINITDPFIAPKLATGRPEALPSTLEEIEKASLLEALERTDWNKAKAARIIGITPRQIGYKIKKYGIHQS